MKLVIQIPAFNEERTIAQTLRDLPRQIKGLDSIEAIVIDDGSTDRTAEIAMKSGAAEVIRLTSHRGLSAAFITGLEAALQRGADVIVNTDADNQYKGEEIAKLIAPVIAGEADVAIGDREIRKSPWMGPVKKLLQRLGSWAVGIASGQKINDVTSGFRAFSRAAAFEINVFNPFTYTLETIIQAGNRNLKIRSIPVRTNPPTRPSRLYRGIFTYVRKSIVTIFRIYTLYRPLKTFFMLGAILFVPGVVIGARFLFFYFTAGSAGHIQSLILAAVLLITGFQTALFGIVADLISVNRRLQEESLIRLRKASLSEKPPRRVEPKKVEIEAPGLETPLEPDTQWVWLGGDEEEEITEGDDTTPRSRRRRRRSGTHRITDPKDRKHPPRLKDLEQNKD